MGFALSGWIRSHYRGLCFICGGLLALILLFGLAGYFWLPGYAKGRLEAYLSQALRRPVTIQRIHVSPYSFAVTVEGLRIGNVFSLESVYVDASSASLFRRIPIISQIDVKSPELFLERESESRLNITDLIEAWQARPKGPTPEFSINNITLERGRVEWVDRVAGDRRSIRDITIGIPFIANVPSKVEIFVEPHFSARINGAPVNMNGRMRPFGSGQDAVINAQLRDFDIAPLSRYLKLPIELNSARLDTRLNIQFRRPQGTEPSLAVTGDVTLRAVDFKAGQQQLAFASLLLQGINANLLNKRIEIDAIVLTDPSMAALRNKSGHIDLGARNAPASSPQIAGSRTASAEWTWGFGRFDLDNGRVRYEDATIHPLVPLNMSEIRMHAGRVDSRHKDAFPVRLRAKVNDSGSLDASGSATLDGNADLRLSLNRVDLVALQGWMAEQLNVVLTRGHLTFDGNARVEGGNAHLAGNLLLGDFYVLDRVNAEDLLRWKSLNLEKVAFISTPFALGVGAVELKDFYAKALINSEGRLNLKDVVRSSQPASVTASAPASAKSANIRIGTVTLGGGTMNFSDKYIRPNYSVRITELAGRIGALAPGTMSPIELQGKVERTAPLQVSGRMDPLSSPPGVDIHASAKGIDMPSFSAYSGRYLGYMIDKGKFSMDVSYRVANGELTAENKLFLDQLTLGQKVESKDALKLPIRLAVALLKNSQGEIDLNIPVRGSLNDPEFSIKGIIVKVLVNLLTKAVTSPFAMLGSLFGGGKDLSQVDFAPGTASLMPDMENQLQSIAKAMADRPGLRLEITGMADPAIDRESLRRTLLNRKLMAQKLADEAREGKPGTLAEISLTSDERNLYLARVFKSENLAGKGAISGGTNGDLTAEEMESRLLNGFVVEESELANLATDRGQRVQAWLVRTGIPSERVFLLAPKVLAGDSKAAGNRVQFSLR